MQPTVSAEPAAELQALRHALTDEQTRRESAEAKLGEEIEQQTATAEILKVISSSPTDVQPVFETIARSAARLCEAEFCHVFRFDGGPLHFEASHGLAPEGVAAVRRAYPMVPGRGSAAARAISSGAVEHIADVHADADYEHGTSDRERPVSAGWLAGSVSSKAGGQISSERPYAGGNIQQRQ